MPDLIVAAIQMDAQVGAVEANLARATELVEEAAGQGAQLIVLPELFATGYAYTDANFELPEPLDGPTGTWIVETARRLGVHLVGSFPARMATGVPDGGRLPDEAYIVALLAAPDGHRWVYRKMHVAMWENCWFERGTKPVIADTALGRIGLIICWDEVFADLARAYQGQVDLLCIPSSPPRWTGTMEDADGNVLAELEKMRSLGKTIDGVVSGAQSIVKRKWNETCKYLTVTNGSFSPWPVAVNTKFWNKLPPDIQKAVMEAAAEVSQLSLAQAEKEDAAALAEAKKSMEVHELQGEWPEARDAGLAAWRKRSGDETADSILKLLGK